VPTADAPRPPFDGDDWLGILTDPLPIAALYEWAVQPGCGAVVVFSGTVRDHATDADGRQRTGVTHLTYEAYEEHVGARFAVIAADVRRRWPETGRVAIVHRVGRLELGASSVAVVVSAPHRGEAFDAARFAIDTLKVSAPIWKRESWEDGEDWALGAHVLVDRPAAIAGEAGE
jgi:molybdopterin synthase catalytic subunit